MKLETLNGYLLIEKINDADEIKTGLLITPTSSVYKKGKVIKIDTTDEFEYSGQNIELKKRASIISSVLEIDDIVIYLDKPSSIAYYEDNKSYELIHEDQLLGRIPAL